MRTAIWHKYHVEVLVELPSGDIVEGGMARDGLHYELPRTREVAKVLTVCYPDHDADGWYFNSTRDRYVAEIMADHILVNPQFISRHCQVA